MLKKTGKAQSPEARLAALEEIRREYHRGLYGGEPPFRKLVTIINGESTVAHSSPEMGSHARRWTGNDEKWHALGKRLGGSQSEKIETMHTTYRLKAKDLNSQFLESVKALFRDQEVEITVSPVDETAYLLQSEANSLRLREAIANINAGTNLVEVPMDDLQ